LGYAAQIERNAAPAKPQSIAAAAALLSKATQPLIVAGLGARKPDGPIFLDCKINADVAAPFMSEFAQFEGRH